MVEQALNVVGGGVLGSLLGGVFRLAPEVIKYVDKKNERAHELAMFDKQVDLEKTRGDIKLQEIGAQHSMAVDTGVLDVLKRAQDQQTEMSKAAGGRIAALSASVRPVVTYALVATYLGLQLSMAVNIMWAGGSMKDVFQFVMTPDFVALVAGILNYHFLNRTLEKRGLL